MIGPYARTRGAVFALVGAVAAVVAAIDVATVDSLPRRVSAFGLFAVAALATTAGGLLLRGQPTSRWIGTAGAVGVILLMITYGRIGYDDFLIEPRPSVVAVVATVIGLTAGAAGVIAWRRDDRTPLFPTVGNRDIRIAHIALVGALLAAALQTMGGWYTTTHSPTQLHPNLTITVEFGDTTPVGHRLAAVPVTITLKNGGQAALDVPMTYYTAYGFRLEPSRADDPRPSWDPNLGQQRHEFFERSAAYGRPACERVLQHGRVSETMANLGPGEEKSIKIAVPVPVGAPTDRYNIDAVRLVVEAAATLEDELNVVDEPPAFYSGVGEPLLEPVPQLPPAGEADVYGVWKIKRSTLLSSLVAAGREVRVGWTAIDPGPSPTAADCPTAFGLPALRPYVVFAYSADGERAEQENEELKNRYDPFYVYAAAEHLLAASPDDDGGPEQG